MPTAASRLSGSRANARSKKPRALDIGGISPLVEPRHSLEIEVHRIGRGRPLRSTSLASHQLHPQLAGETGDEVVLHAEQVGQGPIEALGPQMRAGFRVDKLSVDAQAV